MDAETNKTSPLHKIGMDTEQQIYKSHNLIYF